MNQENIEIKDQSQIPKLDSNSVGSVDISDAKIDVISVTRVDQVLESLENFSVVQDMFDATLSGFRAPTVNKYAGMSRYFIPQDEYGTPCFPKDLVVGNLGSGTELAQGNGQNVLDWNYLWSDPSLRILCDVNKIAIKAKQDSMVKLLSELVVLKEKAQTDLARMTRAAATYTAADWLAFIIDYSIDTTVRKIRTYEIARWMYKDVVNPSSNLHIINANEFRNYLQTTLSEWPVDSSTLILDLGKNLTDATLGKLVLLDAPVIIDWSNSVTNNGNYNGVPCRQIAAKTVYHNDVDVGRILSRTYCVEDLDWAIFINSLYFPTFKVAAGNEYYLHTFKNSIQDQVINFWYRGQTTKSYLPDGSVANDLAHLIFDFRMAKTTLTCKANMVFGYYGQGLSSMQTFVAPADRDDFQANYNMLWEAAISNTDTPTPMWVCFEFSIANGANLTLDDYDYEESCNSVPTNRIYKIPMSKTVFSLAEWNAAVDSNVANRCEYFVPNIVGPVVSPLANPKYVSVFPLTVPRHGSTAKEKENDWGRMSLAYSKHHTLRCIKVKEGKNRRHLVTQSLGF